MLGAHGVNFGRYVPLTLKPNLQDWLKNGIVDGDIKNGTLEFKGRPEDFPFYNDEGLLDIKLSVENAVINYRQDWPQLSNLAGELTWRNQSLELLASQATILNSSIESAQVRIDDIKRANISISANAQGPLQDIQDYFTKASLISADAVIAREFKLSGPANLELDMTLPVTKIPEAMAKRRISGKLKLVNSGLSYKALALDFNDINGAFRFDNEGVTANGVTATLAGNPVEFIARPKTSGRTELTGTGNFNPHSLLTTLRHPLINTLQGSSNWKAMLDLPSINREDSDMRVGIRLTSDLQGIKVDLPEPFKKSEAESREFIFATQFSSGEKHPFAIEYGDSVSALLLANRNSSNNWIDRAELRVNRGKAELPEQGVSVLATLDDFSLSQWQDVLQGGSESGNGKSGKVDAELLSLDYLDADIKSLELAGYPFSEFKIWAMRTSETWDLKLDSAAVKGTVEIPHDRTNNQPIIAALDHLVLDSEFGNPGEEKSMDPANIPALRLSTHKLSYKTFDFTEVSMETKPIDNGIKLQYLQLAGSDLQGRVNGTWQKINDLQSSEFEFDLKSENISKALDSLHIENSFSGGMASAVGGLQWPYAPYQFDFDGLKGMARVEISDGRLKKIKPGAARLLGLFNISTLQRRLSLNFKDIFKKGLAFDTIEGDLRFEDSNVYTDNLRMEGPSAKIAIQGRTGLVAKDYDQIVKVNPEISAGLPVAGALLGGPILGAAVLVAEKLGEQLGQDIDKLVTLEYRVTGPWDDPDIHEVIPPPQKSFAPETSSPDR